MNYISRKTILFTAAICWGAAGGAAERVQVTPDNFVRAESDHYMAAVALRQGGFGRFNHFRELSPIDKQDVIRLNRDTLYSAAVFDLDAAPATITFPEAGGRFMSMQVISEDHYTPMVVYKPGKYTLTKEKIGTRYVVVAVRTLVNPADPADLKKVHALQDALVIEQASAGKFEIPDWDPASQAKVRNALLILAETLPDTNRMFGAKDKVDPVRRLIGAASAWGGNPQEDATYLNVVPPKNDGTTVHRITVRDVPVDGFWSISVYNAKGYYEPNALNAYTLNSVTGAQSADGSTVVQFGGCDGKIPNCLPIMKGWNYMVRLYRPRPAVLQGQWRFPEAQPAG